MQGRDTTSPEQPQPPAEPLTQQPGKLRTWWHPLLTNLLRWQLEPVYQVFEEVPVGKKPLQIDILLLSKGSGELSADARRLLAGLADHLNQYTLLEFKGPTDTLRAGDFRTFLAYAHLYCAQTVPLLEPRLLNLLVVAPQLTGPYRDELRACGVTAQKEAEGIWRLEGPLLYGMWVLETSVLTGLAYPLLAVVSPAMLKDRWRLFTELRASGYAVLTGYVFQQVQQFHQRREEFIMQHQGTEELDKIMREIAARNLDLLPPEERLRGLTPEQLVRGLTPEQLVRGLTPEQLERLRAYLQQLPSNGAKEGSHP
jgi:hypothetical protein